MYEVLGALQVQGHEVLDLEEPRSRLESSYLFKLSLLDNCRTSRGLDCVQIITLDITVQIVGPRGASIVFRIVGLPLEGGPSKGGFLNNRLFCYTDLYWCKEINGMLIYIYIYIYIKL